MKFMGPELGKTWGKWGNYFAALHHCILYKHQRVGNHKRNCASVKLRFPLSLSLALLTE